MSATSRISEPTDREAIELKVTEAPHLIDHKQWVALRALFADEVRTDYTSLFGGEVQEQRGEALVEGWHKMLAPVVTQHLLGPIAIASSGASATARCHVRGYHYLEHAPGGDEWMIAGHYIFELAKDAAIWKIRALTLETFYQTGNTRLLEVARGR